MAEYIEREALKQSIRNMPRTFHPELVFNSSVQKIISNAPAADVVEVRHGKWLSAPTDDYYTGEEPSVIGMVDGEPYASCYCSECREWLVASDEYPVKGYYCPNCGAKMNGKDDNDG